MTKKTYWHADNTPIETTLDRILYDIRKDDKEGLIFDSISVHDIIEDSDGVIALDALITPYAKLEAKMSALQKVMERSGTDIKPVNLTISEPFMRNGVANVAAAFELSDGQGVTIFFHNPDVTPKKIAATDELISWKWLLNKKDITIVVAPEKGVDLNIRQVAVRIMKLAQKNSAAFLRVNVKSAERKAAIDGLKTEITSLESELDAAQKRLEIAKLEKEEREIAAIENPAVEVVAPEIIEASEDDGKPYDIGEYNGYATYTIMNKFYDRESDGFVKRESFYAQKHESKLKGGSASTATDFWMFKTKEEAISYIDQAQKKYEDAAAKKESDAAMEAEKANQLAEKMADDINGFLGERDEKTKALIRKSLDKAYGIDGEIVGTREFIDKKHASGELKIWTKEENVIKDMTRAAYNRAINGQQEAHEKRQREAGTKTVYIVNGYQFGKIPYDYAAHLLAKSGVSSTENDSQYKVPEPTPQPDENTITPEEQQALNKAAYEKQEANKITVVWEHKDASDSTRDLSIFTKGERFFADWSGTIKAFDTMELAKGQIKKWADGLGIDDVLGIDNNAPTEIESIKEESTIEPTQGIDPVAKANIEAAGITETMKKNAIKYLNENPTSHQLFEKETPAGKKAYKAVMESIKTALFAEIKSLSLLFTNYDNDGGVALSVDDSSVIFTVDRDYKLSFWTREGKNVIEIFDSTSTLEELRQWGFTLPFDLDVKAFVANVIKPVVDEFLAQAQASGENSPTENTETIEPTGDENSPIDATLNGFSVSGTTEELNYEYSTDNDVWNASVEEVLALSNDDYEKLIDALENANYHNYYNAVKALRKGDKALANEFNTLQKKQENAGHLTPELRDKRAELVDKLESVELGDNVVTEITPPVEVIEPTPQPPENSTADIDAEIESLKSEKEVIDYSVPLPTKIKSIGSARLEVVDKDKFPESLKKMYESAHEALWEYEENPKRTAEQVVTANEIISTYNSELMKYPNVKSGEKMVLVTMPEPPKQLPQERIAGEDPIIDKLISMGGSEWNKDGKHRIYFKETHELFSFAGYKIKFYGSDSISNAIDADGDKISNTFASKLNSQLRNCYYDVKTGEFSVSNDITAIIEEKLASDVSIPQLESPNSTADIDAEIESLKSETDYKVFDKRIDNLAAKIEDADLMEEYEPKLNELADILTKVEAQTGGV